MVSPDHDPHRTLQSEVDSYLEYRGFTVESLTYHEKMLDESERILRKIYSPTALVVRTAADRIAFQARNSVCFYVEIKSHSGGGAPHNMAFEAIPFLHHIMEAEYFGVECLYVYRDAEEDIDCGFWVKKGGLPIRRFIIPDAITYAGYDYTKMLEHLAPLISFSAPVEKCGRVNGSNDPFVIISKDVAKYVCSDWRALIDGATPWKKPLARRVVR